MAIVSRIAPITGRFKRRVMFDVTASVVVGFGLANLWWYGVVAPKFEKFTAFDKQNREFNMISFPTNSFIVSSLTCIHPTPDL